MFWKTRWENSIDGSNTSYRTLVTYKETHFAAPVDPLDPTTWTGAWADPRFSPPADGGHPANALTGQEFWVNAGTATITVPGKYAKLRFWRNTAAASLSSTQTLSLAKDTLGYEWDIDADNGFRPAGLFDLSSTTASGLQLFTDYGSTTQDGGTATHNLTLYRAPSGALVFGAGTVQWAWGLDDENPENIPEDKNMQQATVNLFADMGVQPQTLIAGLAARDRIDRHDRADVDDQLADRRPAPDRRQQGHDLGQLDRRRRRRRRGRRGLDRRRFDLAPGDDDRPGGHDGQLDVPVDRPWLALDHDQGPRDRRQRQHRHARRRHDRQRRLPVLAVGHQRDPVDPDAGDNSGIEVGVKFKSDAFGQVSGIRYYKASDQHRHPHRQPVELRRDAARVGHVHQRELHRMADRHVLQPGVDPPEHHLRRRLLRARGPLRRHRAATSTPTRRRRRWAEPASTRPRCTR